MDLERGSRAMNGGVLGRGEGRRRYTARGSVMFFKALAEQDGGDFSLMERTLPPGGRALMARFGMETA
jgi:hypothetical protein